MQVFKGSLAHCREIFPRPVSCPADPIFLKTRKVCVEVTLLAKIFGRFNFGQKSSEIKIKPSEIFKRPKHITVKYKTF